MAAKKRASRLGRGLSSLMAKPVDVKPPSSDKDAKVEEEVQEVVSSEVKTATKEEQIQAVDAPAVEGVEQVEQGDEVKAVEGVEESASRGALVEEEKLTKVEAVEVGVEGDKNVSEEQGEVKSGDEKVKVVAEQVAEAAPVVEVGVVKMVSADEIIEADNAAEKIAAGDGEDVVKKVVEEVADRDGEVGSDNAEMVDGEAGGNDEVGHEMGLRYLGVGKIKPNRYQPRSEFDEQALRGLSDSIKRDGLMQPIIVRRLDEVTGGEDEGEIEFELVAGERRWRAAQLAGLEVMPGFVRELDDEQMAEWALIENLQREDLNPIERAEAFKRLADVFSLSHSEVAKRVGVERATVTNHLRLLNLCEDVRGMLRAGELSMGQARALAGIEDEVVQLTMAKQAVAEAWSVRRMEMEVRKLNRAGAEQGEEKESKQEEAKVRKAAYMADLEKHLSEQLSTKIKIRPGRKKGSGTLSIDFYSLDQFDELLGRMGVKFE
ncbi:ParB/RepB/Spo0J family partition protein [Planctomycetota bacterium]|nr:ParB/RepB/Spo0J family partition protein [Planctomycetota bacterium]